MTTITERLSTPEARLRAEKEDLRQRLCFAFSDRSSSNGWATIWATRIAQIDKELSAL